MSCVVNRVRDFLPDGSGKSPGTTRALILLSERQLQIELSPLLPALSFSRRVDFYPMNLPRLGVPPRRGFSLGYARRMRCCGGRKSQRMLDMPTLMSKLI